MAMLMENISLKSLVNSFFVGHINLLFKGLKAIIAREIEEITLKTKKP